MFDSIYQSAWPVLSSIVSSEVITYYHIVGCDLNGEMRSLGTRYLARVYFGHLKQNLSAPGVELPPELLAPAPRFPGCI